MAEIPVEKKSSLAWLWWLLLLAGIIALLWVIFANDDETSDVIVDETTIEATDTVAGTDLDADAGVVTANGAITTLAALSSLGDRIGADVNLDTVAVNRVVGDMAFTIGEGANETLVRFDEVQTPGTAGEGLIDVNPGSTVSLTGRVETLNLADMPQSVQADIAGGNPAYIRAQTVNVLNGGETP